MLSLTLTHRRARASRRWPHVHPGWSLIPIAAARRVRGRGPCSVGADGARPRHPRDDGRGAARTEPDLDPGRGREAGRDRVRDRKRRAVRCGGPDHRDRRCVGVAARPGRARLAGGAQDPSRGRLGGGDGCDLRHARGRGASSRSSCCSSSSRRARSCRWWSRRSSRTRCTRACSARGPFFSVPNVQYGGARPTSLLRGARSRRRAPGRRDHRRRLPRRRPLRAFPDPALVATGRRRGRLRRHRSGGATRARPRIRRDRRHAAQPARASGHSPSCSSRSWSCGGSRSARATRAARSRRSCSWAPRPAASSAAASRTSPPARTSTPPRSRSSAWSRPSAPPPTRRSRRSCSASSSPATTTLILPLMLATVVADLVAKSLMRDSLMTRKLTRRGVRVSTDLHVDVLRTQLVADVMSTDVDTIDTDRHRRRGARAVPATPASRASRRRRRRTVRRDSHRTRHAASTRYRRPTPVALDRQPRTRRRPTRTRPCSARSSAWCTKTSASSPSSPRRPARRPLHPPRRAARQRGASRRRNRAARLDRPPHRAHLAAASPGQHAPQERTSPRRPVDVADRVRPAAPNSRLHGVRLPRRPGPDHGSGRRRGHGPSSRSRSALEPADTNGCGLAEVVDEHFVERLGEPVVVPAR